MYGVTRVLVVLGGVLVLAEDNLNITGDIIENDFMEDVLIDEQAFITLNDSDFDIDISNHSEDINSINLYNSSLLEEICGNSTLVEQMMNSTKHRGLLHGFSESITVILVSEIGDKTFFIAAILAMRNNKLTVFLAALSALFLMTILSALLGWVVTTFIPREYTYYTCTAIMFAFGLKMLWEAWRMDDNEVEEVQKEVEEELAEMDGVSSPNTAESAERGEADGTDTDKAATGGHNNAGYEAEQTATGPAVLQADTLEKDVDKKDKVTGPSRKEGWLDSVIDNSCKENSWFGKKCLQIFKLFVNCFTMTFIAEWGDRSQLATIVLAGLNDVWGVILGGCAGHAVCTGGAVLVGTIIAKFISPRKITFIGALVFIAFAIASIFTDPNEDGIDGIPKIEGYDNCTRLLNHNISQTLELEELEMMEY